MKFIDETTLEVFAGNGGRGCVSFRREKFVPEGGPSGGDGGRGGNVILRADGVLTTFLDAKLRKHVSAGSGVNGMGQNMNGRAGKDIVLRVPAGTVIKDFETQEILADLIKDKQEAIVAKGGRGGLGNMNFKSSTNQAPRYAQKGEPGEKRVIHLELKLLADIGLVGLPNAGKSTLISSISNARPKVADYPFTTKVPVLGLVKHKGRSFTVADIPGLIEGAHEGAGLGIQFLKHVERTRVLVHLIDVLDPIYNDPMKSYAVIRGELKQYSPNLAKLPEILVLTKSDIDEAKPVAEKFQKEIAKKTKDVVVISAAARINLNKLLDKIMEKI